MELHNFSNKLQPGNYYTADQRNVDHIDLPGDNASHDKKKKSSMKPA